MYNVRGKPDEVALSGHVSVACVKYYIISSIWLDIVMQQNDLILVAASDCSNCLAREEKLKNSFLITSQGRIFHKV